MGLNPKTQPAKGPKNFLTAFLRNRHGYAGGELLKCLAKEDLRCPESSMW